MAEKDDVDQTDPGVPSADIPDLKQKEKERKRGGVAWSGARPAGAFRGATGGAARSAASAASGAAGVAGGAQAGAGLLAGLFARIAALSLLGKLAAFAAAVVLLGGAGLLASAMLGRGTGVPGMGSPDLGGISSSMKIRSGGRDRIGVDSKGEIAFDPVAKAKPEEKKAEEAKPAEEAPPADTAADDAAKEAAAAKDRLAHDLSGAKLSGSLGGQFGGKNIFAGGGGVGSSVAPKFGGSTAKFTSQRGKIAPLRASTVRATSSNRSIGRGNSKRALGQLRIAKGMSAIGAQATTAEEASGGAANAFEQNSGNPGTLTAAGAPDGTIAPAMGGGGGGAGDSSGSGEVTVPGTEGIDNIQNSLDQIKSLTGQAQSMKKMGMMLIAIGLVLCAVGASMLPGPWAWAIIAVGVMLGLAGYMQLQKASEMADKAKQMGEELAKRTGEFQSKVVNECVDQAIANGTSLEACRSAEAEERQRQVDAQTKLDLERQAKVSADGSPK